MRALSLDERLYRYLLDHSLREHPVQRELREATRDMKHGGMQIGPEQGQFMALLVRLINARRTIEVGVFTGYSALSVALALPADGRIVACDVNEEWTAMARKYWAKANVADRIDLRLAPALETLDGLVKAGEAGRYDFERCFTLLRKSGLIAVDNTLWSGAVAAPANNDRDTVAIRAFNDALHGDERVEISLLPVGDGLTLATKK